MAEALDAKTQDEIRRDFLDGFRIVTTARRLGLARMTVRRAFERLATEGHQRGAVRLGPDRASSADSVGR